MIPEQPVAIILPLFTLLVIFNEEGELMFHKVA